MSLNRVLNVLVVLVLLVVAGLTAWEVAAIADVAVDDPSVPAAALEGRDQADRPRQRRSCPCTPTAG